MKAPRLPLIALLAASVLAGCNDPAPQAEISEQPRRVKTLLIETPDSQVIRSFPGRVSASRRATLSFQISGKIRELKAREGQKVKAGQTLARLDDRELNIALREAEASHRKAAADFKRASELVGAGHVSRRDYDALEATLATAKAAVDRARTNLSYARLKAPFAGSVTRRLVNDAEQIGANQPVLDLQDLSLLEIQFDVPENLIQRIERRSPEQARKITAGRVFASFESLPGQRFELSFKEAAAEADKDTQTFEVSFTMPRPPALSILPGMSATVTANMEGIVQNETANIRVPARAVVADSGMAPKVWLVDPADNRLRRQPVTVGTLQGKQIEILSGLNAGDRVVVAGMAYLSDGMEVELMPEREQAEER